MANDSAQPNQNKMILWFVIMGLVLVIVTGGTVAGTYMFMGNNANASAAAPAEAAEPEPDPVFVALDPFTVNLQDRRGRILYMKLSLKIAGEEQAARVEQRMPEIRNRILMVVTDVQAEEVSSGQGKQALAETLQAEISKPLNEGEEPIPVTHVLFTEFIIQ